MRRIYLVPATILEGLVIGAHHVLVCPSAPEMRLVVVEEWLNEGVRDWFEAHPGALELCPWDAEKPAPGVLVAAFATDKTARISEQDTIGSALWKIRAGWSAAHY